MCADARCRGCRTAARAADGEAADAPPWAARGEAGAQERTAAAVSLSRAADNDAAAAPPWAARGEAGAPTRAAAAVTPPQLTAALPRAADGKAAAAPSWAACGGAGAQEHAAVAVALPQVADGKAAAAPPWAARGDAGAPTRAAAAVALPRAAGGEAVAAPSWAARGKASAPMRAADSEAAAALPGAARGEACAPIRAAAAAASPCDSAALCRGGENGSVLRGHARVAAECSAPARRARRVLAALALAAIALAVLYGAMKEAVLRNKGPHGKEGPHDSSFQVQVRVDGSTVTLDVCAVWTATDLKAALRLKAGRACDDCYLVTRGGKILSEDAAASLSMHDVGSGDVLELRSRLLGGTAHLSIAAAAANDRWPADTPCEFLHNGGWYRAVSRGVKRQARSRLGLELAELRANSVTVMDVEDALDCVAPKGANLEWTVRDERAAEKKSSSGASSSKRAPDILITHTPTDEKLRFTDEERRAPEATSSMVEYVERVARLYGAPNCSELVRSISPTTERAAAAAGVAQFLDAPHTSDGVAWVRRGVNGNELAVKGVKMRGYSSYGYSQAERRCRRRQANNTLAISKEGHDAIVAACSELVASAQRTPGEEPMSVLNLPAGRPGACFLLCASYLLKDMEQMAGGAEASPLVNGHCVNSTDPNAAFSWHVDNHAEADDGEYIESSIVCLCSEGRSSIMFAGAGEMEYPGVGGYVAFPAWCVHRTGRVEPSGESQWKIARFGARAADAPPISTWTQERAADAATATLTAAAVAAQERDACVTVAGAAAAGAQSDADAAASGAVARPCAVDDAAAAPLWAARGEAGAPEHAADAAALPRAGSSGCPRCRWSQRGCDRCQGEGEPSAARGEASAPMRAAAAVAPPQLTAALPQAADGKAAAAPSWAARGEASAPVRAAAAVALPRAANDDAAAALSWVASSEAGAPMRAAATVALPQAADGEATGAQSDAGAAASGAVTLPCAADDATAAPLWTARDEAGAPEHAADAAALPRAGGFGCSKCRQSQRGCRRCQGGGKPSAARGEAGAPTRAAVAATPPRAAPPRALAPPRAANGGAAERQRRGGTALQSATRSEAGAPARAAPRAALPSAARSEAGAPTSADSAARSEAGAPMHAAAAATFRPQWRAVVRWRAADDKGSAAAAELLRAADDVTAAASPCDGTALCRGGENGSVLRDFARVAAERSASAIVASAHTEAAATVFDMSQETATVFEMPQEADPLTRGLVIQAMFDAPEHAEYRREREEARLRTIAENNDMLVSLGLQRPSALLPSAKAGGKRPAPPSIPAPSARVLRERTSRQYTSDDQACDESSDDDWACDESSDEGCDEQSADEDSSSEQSADDERRRGGSSAKAARRPPLQVPPTAGLTWAPPFAPPVRLEVTRPMGAAPASARWVADTPAVTADAAASPARAASVATPTVATVVHPSKLTVQECYDAARDEGLALVTQEQDAQIVRRRGPAKKHATGFVCVHHKKVGNGSYPFGKVRDVHLGYYDRPEQAALAVARFRARERAATSLTLAEQLGPVRADAARHLSYAEVASSRVEELQALCYQRGLDTSGTGRELKDKLHTYYSGMRKGAKGRSMANVADPQVQAAADALRAAQASVAEAQAREQRLSKPARSKRVLPAFDLATATDGEAAALAEELGLELSEHEDATHAGVSTFKGVTLRKGTNIWVAVERGGKVRRKLGSYSSATAAAVAVAQCWSERVHPVRQRGVLGGFACPKERMLWGPDDACRAIARAVHLRYGTALPPTIGDEGASSDASLPPLPDDFGDVSDDD